MPRKTLKKVVIPSGDGWIQVTNVKAYIQSKDTDVPFAWAPTLADLSTLTEADCHTLKYPDDNVVNPAGSTFWVKQAQNRTYTLTVTEEI